MKRGGRMKGSTNVITRELKQQLVLHASNELQVVLSRCNELELIDRYKLLLAMMRLIVPKNEFDLTEPPIIHIHSNL